MACSAALHVPAEPFEIVLARIDAGPDAAREAAALLSVAERQRASRFLLARDRRRFIVARATLRRLLAMRLCIAPRAIELTCGSHGKPALAPRQAGSGLRFNVSHCDDLAAYVFAQGREVGVDIETVRAMPDADSIAQRFFSRCENDAYRQLQPRDRPAGFFNCWTRKEAFVKAIGDGLSYPLDRFDVSLMPGEPAWLLRIEGARASRWSLHAFDAAPGVAGACVVENP